MKISFIGSLFLFFQSYVSYAGFGVWVSGSTMWGQGNYGGIYRFENNHSLGYSQQFTFDWTDKRISYHSESLSYNFNSFSLGTTFRADRNTRQTEKSPFISYRHNVKSFYVYHNIEYRYNNLLYIDDYFRYNISLEYDFAHYKEYDFFIRLSSFFNVGEGSLEKHFFYLGIKRVDKNATISLYITPYKYGTLGNSWDDKKFFGGGFVYRF